MDFFSFCTDVCMDVEHFDLFFFPVRHLYGVVREIGHVFFFLQFLNRR